MDLITTQVTHLVWAISFVFLVVWVLYARTVHGLLTKIKEENRFVAPQQAWVLVIPFLNVYWNFFIARRISDSLNNEFFDRKIAEEEMPGLGAGLSFAWMFFLAHLLFLPPFMLMTFSLLSIIYFIRYWVKIYHFKLLLEEHDQFLNKQ